MSILSIFFMRFKNLMLLFPAVIFIISCKESSIIGHWQNVDYKKYRKIIKNDTSSIGNLTISADSTIFINGDGKKTIDTVPGWHTGGDFSSTWSISNKMLVFKLPEYSPYEMHFKIIRLTKRKLTLRSSFNRNHKSDLKYRRI